MGHRWGSFWMNLRAWVPYVALLCVSVGIAGALVIAALKNLEPRSGFFEILRTVISWPFVVGVLGLAFGVTFQREISQFIQNIGLIRFPGGEIRATQTPEGKVTTSPVTEEGSITLLKEDQVRVAEVINKLVDDMCQATSEREKTREEKEEMEKVVDLVISRLADKHREAVHWWFQYLSLFLVPITKTVLQWFALQEVAPTKEYYNQVWRAAIPDDNQREIIFMVLSHHRLIEAEGAVYKVSQAGNDFLDFLRGKGPYV
jgi:ABC-type sugar transport system permease subunit